MNVIHERCGGLDVHKDTVVACRRVMEGAAVTREVRSFSTTTRGVVGAGGLAARSGLHARGDGSD
jgi:hypothetical protein